MNNYEGVDIETFANELEDLLKDYSNEVIEEIELATKEAGDKLRDLVKSRAPVDTGKYKRAITVTHSKSFKGLAGATIHVRSPHYRLAHLLERPHVLRNGGLSVAQPHWTPARNKIEPLYIKKITEKIEGI